MLNNIEVEDLGTTKEEFSLEMKKKFISNSNSMLMKGTEIIKEMFLILGVDMLLYSQQQKNPCDSKIHQYPIMIYDNPIAATLFIQEDGISFLCHVLSFLPCDHQCLLAIMEQKITEQIEAILLSYLKLLHIILLMEEAQYVILSTSFYFNTLINLLHIPNIVIINDTVLLFNYICENNPETADIIAQCFIDETSITSMNTSELSLSILICLLDEGIDLDAKVNIIKFLAVLIHSSKSLSSRTKVRFDYLN